MKVEYLLDYVSKLDKNEELFFILYLHDEANELAEENDLLPLTNDEWQDVIHYMNGDDDIYQAVQDSFQSAVEKVTKKREAK